MNDTLKFLLVSEGPTDIAFLKKLCVNFGKKIKKDIEIMELSPQRDATTGKCPPHGWTEVQRWCKLWRVKTEEEISETESPFAKILRRRNWRALVELQNAQGLIIQIDTDIAEEISDMTCRFSDFQGTRKEFCKKAVLLWLNETDASLNNAYLLLTTYAIETWILATHDENENIFNDLQQPFLYEEIQNVEHRLVNLGYASKVKNGSRKLQKQENKYSEYAEKVFTNFDKVKNRCKEASDFYTYLTSFNYQRVR